MSALTTLFATQSRSTILMVILIAVAGLGSLLTLGRQEDPTLTERFGVISTVFPGASAERVEALVTEPIEARLLELAEVRSTESRTQAGISLVTLELREDLVATQVDQAWSLVREQVDLARQTFPAGVQTPNVRREYIGAATMVVSLSWEDGSEDTLGLITRLARDLEDRFQSMSGTDETRLFGEVTEEVRVHVDPDQLAALGLTAGDVAAALSASDAKAPAGSVRAGSVNLNVEIDGEFTGLERVRAAPLVQRPNGDVVRVGDIARVEKGVATPVDAMGFIDGRRSVLVAAYLQANLRVDTWTDNARLVVDGFTAELPRGVRADIVFEQNTYVKKRLFGLAGNLMLSGLIVFAVLFFMMGWRAALIVGSALPLTILLVLFLIRLYDEPLHQMSVTGLVIALGLLIDNAIVMVDEYRLKRARGADRIQAVDQSIRHLFAPLLASTATTVLAFAPIALMPGAAGEFISMIGLSVIFALISSFFLAMTVVPAFASWFDAAPHPDAPPRFWRDGISFAPLTRVYRGALGVVVRRPLVGMAAGFVFPILGFVAASTLPMQFFPPTDRDTFQTEIVLPTATSIEETRRVVERANALIGEYDEVVTVGWMIGEAAPRTYYNVQGTRVGESGFAAGWVRTTGPEATRAIVADLQARVRTEFPNARFLVLPFEQGPPVPAPIEVRLVGPDFAVLSALGDELRVHLAASENVTYTTAGLSLGAPIARVQADESASLLTGRPLAALSEALRADLDGVVGGSVLESVEELPVRVLLEDDARGALDAVRAKPLPGVGDGLGTPLSALGDITLEPEVAVITRYNGERDNPVYGFIEPFTLPAVATADFLARVEAAGFTTPPGYRLEIAGEAAERGNAVGNLLSSAGPLLVLMVGALVLAFNSFRYAAVIAVVGVMSVGLAFFGVFMFGEPLGFNAIVGAMGLIGLAINGSIVVLSALRTDPGSMAADAQAIVDTTVDATRHIVSTTFTTIGGFVPLLLSGDSFWLPLASAIAGGVAGSAILALFFAPSMFAMMARRRKKRQDRRAAKAMKAGSAAAAPAE